MPALPTLLPQYALHSLMHYASRAPAGAIVEVGVYQGGSASALATLGRPLFLYDTFEGMPFQGPLDGNPVGRFADCSAEAVQEAIPSAVVIKGLFPDSLVPMPPIGFVHADGDQYQTTKDILRVLPPLMVRGGFILLDDFGVEDCAGCTQAVQESPFRVLILAESGKALIIV